MKSFLLVIGAIVGLTFVIADDDPVENVKRDKTQATQARAKRATPSLAERNAQRDAHRRDHLASTLKHSPTCNCGNH